MINKLTYILSFCALSFGIAPVVDAQVKQPAKKTTKPAKTTTVKNKPAATKLGEAAAAKAKQDTTKKGGQSSANNNTNPGGSLSEEIVVTTVYKPVLADAVKIRRNPNLDDTQPYKAPLSYNALLDKRLEQNSQIRQLEAIKMPAERDSIMANNFVRAGLGSLKTTFGEAYFNNGADEALQLGAYLKHFGQQGSALPKQNESRSEIGVFGKSITEKNTLTGRINYLRRDNYFYGYDNTLVNAPIDPTKQHFNTLSGEGELARNYQDSDRAFTYAVKLNGYMFNNAFSAKENNVVLTGYVNQTINQFYAGLSASMDIASQKDVNYALNNSFLRLNPYLKFQGDNYKIDAGVNIVKEFGFSQRFSIFPAVKLEYQVIPDYVRLFAEAKGDINRTSLRYLSELNPYLGQNIGIKNSVDKLDVTIGLKGRIVAGLGFKAAIFRNSISDLPLFVSNVQQVATPQAIPAGNNRFAVIYDTGRSRVTGFNGDLDYKASDNVDIFGRVEFRDYKLNTQAQAWNLPKFKLTAGTTLHITNKVDVNGSLLFRGSTKDVVGNSQIVTLKSFADLNGGVSYKATKQISVFVQANNILNSNYQTYMYYPNYGFNIFGGVGFTF
ncbi:TonB-dependent receptor [Mucilaginibacter sp. CSA2-8R]|uniref:TonB-dependent receptor n=1 Tax=Mucilaginibacter sp. CSA2-8R TaxID=3141542 RepID=UPI00315C6B6E